MIEGAVSHEGLDGFQNEVGIFQKESWKSIVSKNLVLSLSLNYVKQLRPKDNSWMLPCSAESV